MPQQVRLSQDYADVPAAELVERITARKRELDGSLCILGHHYQADEVIRFADFTGDSLKLSQLAADRKDARYIVFCGVHFMAESADIVSAPEQVVCLPNLLAGCAMAEMADAEAVAEGIEEVRALGGAKVVPITYVNSTAAIKAITGRAGGACCTSGNVRNVFEWALRAEADGGAGAERIFAIPDQHLGRNTAVAMGRQPDDCVLYDPMLPDGGLTAQQVSRATFILWKGHCYVHQFFTAEQVRKVRAADPDVRVIVHPECPREVVQLADAAGSTEQIIRAVDGAEPGSRWAIGTEGHLVNRLARRHPDQSVRLLSDGPAVCAQMRRIDLPHLLWILDNLAAGSVVNRVSVPPDIASDARTALERMLSIKASTHLTPTEERP